MDTNGATVGFAALAQPTRLAAFRLLLEAGPAGMAAGTVAEALAVPHNTLSTHLAILERARLVSCVRAGRSQIYSPNLDGIGELIGFLVQDCCGGHPELCAPIADLATACCAPVLRPRAVAIKEPS